EGERAFNCCSVRRCPLWGVGGSMLTLVLLRPCLPRRKSDHGDEEDVREFADHDPPFDRADGAVVVTAFVNV
ncbi:MAG: hypothetical protein ABL904_06730, partial [Hyphomicrobiaceae bacterium]